MDSQASEAETQTGKQMFGKAAPPLGGLLAPEQVATLIGVSRRTVYVWIDQGLMPARRVGPRLLRVSAEDLGEFERRSAEARP